MAAISTGFFGGLLSGTAVSALLLGAVSLATPLPLAPVTEAAGAVPVAAGPATEDTASESPEAAAEPAAEPVPAADAAPADAVATGAPAPAPAAAPAPATAPDASPAAEVVEVPAGSEFARPKTDEDAVLPAPEPARPPSSAPAVAAPAAETAPAPADATSAAAPVGTDAPAAPVAPETQVAAPEAPLGDDDVTVAGAAALPQAAAPADETPGADVMASAAPPQEAPAETPPPLPPPESPAAPAAPAQPPGPAPEATPAEALQEAPAARAAPADETADATADAPPTDAPPADAALTEEAQAAEPAAEPEILPVPGEGAGATADPNLPPVIVADAPEPPKGVANAPVPGFRPVPGVKINRLPRIGDPAPGAASAPASAEALPSLAPDGAPADAIARYGAPFENPGNRPLLAMLILDIGEAQGGLDAQTLATIAAPVTVAIDPTMPDAAQRAATYRAAGFEIAILAQSLPDRATASDLEVAYQSYRATLPEAVVFLGRPDAPYQSNRQAAEHLVDMLKPDGIGLVTYARGLDPASQFAAENALPHAEIYRVVDDGGATTEGVRRALDRAAFEAAQTGRVTVMATSRPETVTAIFAWAAEGRKGVALVPVSAVALAEVQAPPEPAKAATEETPAPASPAADAMPAPGAKPAPAYP